MIEFVYGTNKQYDQLRASLEDHKCHVFHCMLPDKCSRNKCRIGFEKENNTYALFIDKGIAYRGNEAGFREWLEEGTLRFLDFTDMKEFLKNLKPLYKS